MAFGIFSYLITILVFAGTAIIIELWLSSRFKRYFKLIIVIAGIGILGTLIAEPVALDWRIWSYSEDKFFGIYVLGAAFETLIYALFVSIAISFATLIWSDYEKNNKLSFKRGILLKSK